MPRYVQVYSDLASNVEITSEVMNIIADRLGIIKEGRVVSESCVSAPLSACNFTIQTFGKTLKCVDVFYYNSDFDVAKTAIIFEEELSVAPISWTKYCYEKSGRE
jgi:hypothetical protein